MSSDMDTNTQFEALHTGLRPIREVEKQANSPPQLDKARMHLASSAWHIGTPEFSREFSEAIGTISSIAVTNGCDELAEDALELGGDAV